MVLGCFGGGETALAWWWWGASGWALKLLKRNKAPLGLGQGCLDNGKYRGFDIECLAFNEYRGLG